MKKLKLYLETSVWNFLFADDAPEKKRITESLFREVERGKYEIFMSEIVNVEIMDAPTFKVEMLVQAVRRYAPSVFYADADVDALAEAYIENGLLDRKRIRDVLHLAFASANGMDILLSWNMKHMVRRKTQYIVNLTNRACGYLNLEIWTPEELMDYEL